MQSGSFRRPERPLDSGRRLAADWLYLPRAIGFIRRAVLDHPVESIDPYEMITGPHQATWSDQFSLAYTDAGAVRVRCASYFDDQLRFLLGRLRTIRGLERLSVVHFPDWSVQRSRSAGLPAPSVDAFKAMVRDRTLDGYLDLTQALERNGAPPRDLQCPYDSHFCDRGNAWIAAQILQFTLRR